MARGWENTRWRRIAMQAVLCAALGLTVLLAWWIERSHAAALLAQLGPRQLFANKVFSLDVQLPQGWVIETNEYAKASYVRAMERSPRFGAPRLVQIKVQRFDMRSRPMPGLDEIAVREMESRAPVGPARRFDFLGNPGILLEYPLASLQDSKGLTLSQPPELYAGTILPGPQISVSVEMAGPRTFAPSDTELFQDILKSLSIADPAHPSPLLPGMSQTDDENVLPQSSTPGVPGLSIRRKPLIDPSEDD